MEGNGRSVDGMTAPPETVNFRIGGVDVKVPILMFQDLDECKADLQALDAGLYWVDYGRRVLRIVAHQLVAYERPDLDLEDREKLAEERFLELRKRCTGGESSNLATQMNGLFRASGFTIPEPAPAPETENPGTGTSTPSVSDSPLEGFAATTRD